MNKGGVHIKVKNFEKSLKFYLDLGFEPKFLYGSEELRHRFKEIDSAPEKYNGVTFQIGSMLFEIADGHIAVKEEVFKETVNSSKISLMFDVDKPSYIREVCEKNDYKIRKEETEYPWGTRELVVEDPDGIILVFREFIK